MRVALPEAPPWLVRLIEKPRYESPAPVAPAVPPGTALERIKARLDAPTASGSADDNFARTVLERAREEMVAAGEGTRNHTLNRIAFDLYGLAKGGRLTEADVTIALTEAASAAGLKPKEVGATLESARSSSEPKQGAPLAYEKGTWTPSVGPSAAELVAEAQTPPSAPQGAAEAPQESRAERQVREAREYQLAAVEALAGEMWADLLDDEALIHLPPPRPLIRGIVMQDSLAVLYGKPGNGKSFVCVDWALSVAHGQWWDMRPVKQGPVLYIAAEGAPGLGKRVRAWKQHHGVHGAIPGFRVYPRRINLLDTLAPAAMVLVARRLEPQLIVIDTLSRSMPGGNENAPEDMTLALENADLLRQETGATVLIVHHTPKDGGSIRGHSSLEGAADTTIEVRKAEAVITISVEKQKDAPEAAPIVRYLRPVQFGIEPDAEADSAILSSTGDADDEERASVSTQREVFLVLDRNVSRGEALSGPRWEELCKDAGISRRSFYRGKKELADEGFVRNVGSDKRPSWRVIKPWA